jgi:hypothetical protein
MGRAVSLLPSVPPYLVTRLPFFSLLRSGRKVIKIMLQQESYDNCHVTYLSMSGCILLRNFQYFKRMNFCVDLWKTAPMLWAFLETCTTIQPVKRVGDYTESARSLCWSPYPAIFSHPYPVQSTSHSHTIYIYTWSFLYYRHILVGLPKSLFLDRNFTVIYCGLYACYTCNQFSLVHSM